jgi:hypothetical protein
MKANNIGMLQARQKIQFPQKLASREPESIKLFQGH